MIARCAAILGTCWFDHSQMICVSSSVVPPCEGSALVCALVCLKTVGTASNLELVLANQVAHVRNKNTVID